jgi:hypothetical protein
METKIQPKLALTYEALTFTRSDGEETGVDLLMDILDQDDTHGTLLWAVLMKLQGVMEFQQILAEQNRQMLGVQQLTAQALQDLAKRASTPPTMPDPDEYITKMIKHLETMGIPNPLETLAKLTGKAATDKTEVTVSRPNGGDA